MWPLSQGKLFIACKHLVSGVSISVLSPYCSLWEFNLQLLLQENEWERPWPDYSISVQQGSISLVIGGPSNSRPWLKDKQDHLWFQMKPAAEGGWTPWLSWHTGPPTLHTSKTSPSHPSVNHLRVGQPRASPAPYSEMAQSSVTSGHTSEEGGSQAGPRGWWGLGFTVFHLMPSSHKPWVQLLITEQNGVDSRNGVGKAEKRSRWCGQLMWPSVTAFLTFGGHQCFENQWNYTALLKKKRPHHTYPQYLAQISRGFCGCPEDQLWTWTKTPWQIPAPTIWPGIPSPWRQAEGWGCPVSYLLSLDACF